jgi:hypothetical protein
VQAWRVNKYNLRIRSVMDTANSGACRLWLIRHNRDLDAADCVYERRLSNVGSANKGYKSATHSYRVVTNTTHSAKKNSQCKF